METSKQATQQEDQNEQCVLVLTPTGRDATLAASALRGAGLHVAGCPSVEFLAQTFAISGAGAAVIAQEALTPPALDTLIRMLAHQHPWSDLPLIILTGSGRPGEVAGTLLLQVADRLGNATFLERPLRIATLVRAVRVALRARNRQYEIRGHLRARELATQERLALIEQQRAFLRDVLTSVTEGRLRLCDTTEDLPPRLTAAGMPIALTRSSLRRLRSETSRIALAQSMTGERVDDIVTAANEAGMNAVTHAGGGMGSIFTDPERGTIQVWIEDQGSGIDVARLPRATLERGYSSAGTFGHGFWMMLNTTDRTFLLTGPTGTTVVVEQDRTAPEPAWMAAFANLGDSD